MKNLFLLILVTIFFQAPPAKAYYTLLTTGDLLQPHTYKVTGFIQFITDGPVGTTFNGQLESYLRDDASLLFSAGVGTHQMVSAAIKWVPIPDLARQPAVGGVLGIQLGQFKTQLTSQDKAKQQQDFSIFAKTFLSKQFLVEAGEINSFASLHLSLQKFKEKTKVPLLLGVGTELKLFAQPKFNFIAELGFNLNQAFSYISVGLVFLR
ncbi:MAG: hypothetical protein HAW63_03385 [Bdellovibrionaceae bacterium]|nr:hypothetical protein [Pseudobdellovibrionaceae bacterium]